MVFLLNHRGRVDRAKTETEEVVNIVIIAAIFFCVVSLFCFILVIASDDIHNRIGNAVISVFAGIMAYNLFTF